MSIPERDANGLSRPRLTALLVGLAVGVVVVVVASALLGPPLHGLFEQVWPGAVPFRRFVRRLAQLLTLVALVAGLRMAGVRSLRDIGLGWSRARGRTALFGALFAALFMAALFAVELAAGTRVGAPARGATSLVLVVLEAAAAGAVIGLLEEAACRGALLLPFGCSRGARFWVATAAVSVLFASAHFLRGGRTASIDAEAGWRIWQEVFGRALQRGEAWTGLFVTAAFFALVAVRRGHVWGVAGIHAGAVFALQVGGALTDPARGDRSLFLVDGLLPGYGIAAILALGGIALLLRDPLLPPRGESTRA